MRDLFVLGATLGGWVAVTYALAGLTTPLLWPLSLGLLALCCVGFRFLRHVAWHGVTRFLPRPKR